MSHVQFKEEGKGPPLVLIHGFCETHEIWADFAKRLTDRFRVFMPDLPGFGESEPAPDPFSIADIGNIMAEWMSGLRIGLPVVIGHSLGGYVTLAMLRKNPDLAAGFGLFHSSARPDSEEKQENRNKSIDFVNRNGVAPYIDTFVPALFYRKDHPALPKVFAIARQTPKPTLTGYLAAMRDRPDQTGLLTGYQNPVLILAGEKDEVIPLSTLEEQAVLPPKCDFSVLRNTGHMGMFEDISGAAQKVAEFTQNCQ